MKKHHAHQGVGAYDEQVAAQRYFAYRLSVAAKADTRCTELAQANAFRRK
jgi:hypothetical protein